MATNTAHVLLMTWVSESTLSQTPSHLMGRLMAERGMTRREARACLTRCVDENLLAYRQALGRTVVVPSMNRYHPLAPGVVLAPSHLPPPADGTFCISMKEGISFGNGTHPTTRLCATLMMGAHSTGSPWRLALDLGTGTGVLALLALTLGCAHADATDIDPIAIHDAMENAALNGFASRLTAHHADAFVPSASYSLVTANLRSPTLVSLVASIGGWMDAGGDLVLSGIREGEEVRIKSVYAPLFALQREKMECGWVGLHFKKRGS